VVLTRGANQIPTLLDWRIFDLYWAIVKRVNTFGPKNGQAIPSSEFLHSSSRVA